MESQGKEMEEYFETQMKKIREWNPEVVESGLALDILAFHITDLGTSKRCFIEDIRSRYRHLAEEYKSQPDIVDQLVNRFKSSEIFLLNDIGRGYTSLPHDTLAPIVMREYNRSDKLGQRSARILDAKRPDFVRALQVNDTKKVRLDDNDLEVVTGGILGMRALEDEEKTLLQISLEEREKRLRLRRILVRGGIVTGLFILFLGIVSGILTVSMVEQVRNVVVDRAHVASLKKQENNSGSYKEYLLYGEEEYAGGEEVRLAHFAYHAQGDEKRLDVVQNYFKLAGPAEEEGNLPYFLALEPSAQMLGLDYDRGKGLVAPLGYGERLAYWPASGYYTPITIDFTEYVDLYFEQVVGGAPTNVERTAAFSADGKGVQVQMRNEAAPLYEMAGQLVPAPTLAISSEYTGEDGQVSFDTIGYYDLFSGEFVGDYGVRLSEDEFNKVYAYVTPMVGEPPLEGSWELFSWKLMDAERQVFRDTVYQQLKERGWKISGASRLDLVAKSAKSGSAIPLRPTRSFSRATGNYCMVWNSGDENTAEPASEFFHYGPLDFLTALSEESFLTVNPEGLLAIWNNQGTISSTLLPSGTSIADAGVSPGHRHIFAITKDSALVWTLDGVRAGGWAHANVRKHAFSADGARFFTQSSDTIRIWQAEGKAAPVYAATDTAYQIATARFQEDGKLLVIGLNPKSAVRPKDGLLQLFGKKGNSARIDYWDIENGKVEQTFETPSLHLADASVSPDGKFAVALDPENAFVIPSSQFKIRKWEYNDEGIKPEPKKKGDAKDPERVFLSPSGKYIVRQSFTENRIQLFDQKGKPVTAYLYGQFSPGFRGEFFTPDDQYLVAKKANEALLWRPDDGKIPWPEIAELSMDEKRLYELDTFFDAVPGAKDDAKWWALGLLGVALIYSLVFFSGAIINYVQRKDYLSLGLYGAAFLILNLLLGASWAAGFEEPQMKKVAFYGLVLANLGILGIGIFQTWKRGKWQNLIPLGLVALMLAVGLVQFAALESAQLKAFEWPLLVALVLLAVFTGLAGYPVYRAIGAYRAENKLAFYRWLLLPSGFASFIIWGAISIAITSGDLTPALDMLASLALTAIIIHKCVQYFRNREFWALGAYALPALLVVSMLSLASQPHIVAMAAAFVYGRQAYLRQAYGKSYLFISASIFFLAGALSQFFITADFQLLLGPFVVAPALVLLFYALRMQLNRLSARKAEGRSRLPNRLAILGLWFAAFAGAGLYSDSVMVYDDEEMDSEEYYYTEYAEEEEYSDLLTGIMADYPVWQSVFDEVNRQSTFFEAEEGYYLEIKDDQIIAEFEVTESTPEYVEIFDASRRLKLRIYEDRAFFQNDGDPNWYFLFEGEWIQPAEIEEALESDETGMEEKTEKQKLIGELFDADENVRNEARRQLSGGAWSSDPEVIPELIEYSYSNPDTDAGLWNALYLLERRSDEELASYRGLVSDFLDWMSQKGYGSSTMERIRALEERL